MTLSVPATTWSGTDHPAALLLTGDSARCNAHTCAQFKRRCRALHPRFFGSLMVHVSLITEPFWPIFTVRDALDVAEYFTYQTEDGEGFDAYWKVARDELRAEGVRRPTREQLRARAAQSGLPPRHLFRQIGLDEVLPALKPRLCLSLEELRTLSTGHSDIEEILRLLVELQLLNQTLLSLYDQPGIALWCESGEYRTSPLYVLSGQAPQPGRPHLHAVQELLEEEWQMAAQCEGYRDHLIYTVQDRKSARRAAKLLPGLHQSFELTRQIADLLTDPQEA